jgi:hypothetical protein
MQSDETRRFIEDVRTRVGSLASGTVALAVEITLEAFGTVTASIPESLTLALGPELSARVRTGRQESPSSVEATYAEVARRTGLREGVVIELVHSILTELAARMPVRDCDGLRRMLPSPWAERLVPSSEPTSSVAPGPVPARAGFGRTFATGRPGGARPIADSAPKGHTHSIAEEDEPRADRSLASTHGAESETTLSRGRPGSRHNVAGSD